MISLSKTLQQPLFAKISVLLLLIALLIIGTVPGYINGKWEWQQPPPVETIQELRKVRSKGLDIPAWKTLEQVERQMGEQKWSLQTIENQDGTIKGLVQLLPQNDIRKQPNVEWVDVASAMRWEEAQLQTVEFTVTPPQKQPVQVKARFFRGATKNETFAVLQWYAWKEGGDPSPLKWFIADQAAQLRKQRTPWTAVSIVLPMEQLGRVDREWEKIKPLAENIQIALMDGKL